MDFSFAKVLQIYLPRWCYFLPLPSPPFHPLKIMPFGNLCKITDIFQYILKKTRTFFICR